MNFKSTPNNLSYLLGKHYSSLLWDFDQVHFWRKSSFYFFNICLTWFIWQKYISKYFHYFSGKGKNKPAKSAIKNANKGKGKATDFAIPHANKGKKKAADSAGFQLLQPPPNIGSIENEETVNETEIEKTPEKVDDSAAEDMEVEVIEVDDSASEAEEMEVMEKEDLETVEAMVRLRNLYTSK